ncbi:MAG: M50 family metallopeptidase [Saprospiraceae bacterium]|jgi:hypothetical protein|nr:M50 family metallopeptidase [Saprospiraceae bacterium]
MDKNSIIRISIALGIFVVIQLVGGTLAKVLLYPITILVTALHELGHALGAILTGGSVNSLRINEDGSGQCASQGGVASIILMGGYIGSAIFGNLLFYLGVKRHWLDSIILTIFAVLLSIAAIFWYDNLLSSILLIAIAVGLIYIRNTVYKHEILIFIGIASIWHIIKDFNVGPSSDLEMYAKTIGIFSSTVWKYVWLLIVISLTALNFKWILQKKTLKSNQPPK